MSIFSNQQPRDLSLLTNEEQLFFQRWVEPLERRTAALEEAQREREPEARFQQIAPFQRKELNVPQAQNFQVLSQTQDILVTHAILSWQQPRDPNVAAYELWVSGITEGVEEPVFLREVTKSPASVQVTADADVTAVLYLVPRMKDGRRIDPSSGPTITLPIVKEPAVGPGSITSTELADGAVGDAKLDRTTDPIVVTNADIANATIQSAKIADLQASKITAGTLAAGVILSENIAATQINAGTLGAGVILASNIAATQISAGTLAAGVILASNIAATQISAGTMSAVNVSAGTYSLTSGLNQMTIDGTSGFRQLNTSTNAEVKIINGNVDIKDGNDEITLDVTTYPKIKFFNSTGSNTLEIGENSFTNAGLIELRDSSGNTRMGMGVGSTGSSFGIDNPTGTEVIRLESINDLGQANSGLITIDNSSGTAKLELGVDSSGDGEIRRNATQWGLWHDAAGKELVGGSDQFTGTNTSKSVSTGLSSIDFFVCVAVTGGSPASTDLLGTGSPTGGSITVYRPTSGASGRFFYWLAVGNS